MISADLKKKISSFFGRKNCAQKEQRAASQHGVANYSRATYPKAKPLTTACNILLHPGYPFTPFNSVQLRSKGGWFSHAGTERAWLVAA